eukprot:gene21194-27456_t
MDNYDKNITSWTKEQIIEYLNSRGVNQSLEEYSSDDLLAIAQSFEDENESERLNLILSFCEATGTEFEEAEKILESSKWDLVSSISSHFENADIINDRTKYQNISYQNSRIFTAAASSTISDSHPVSMNIPAIDDEDGIHPNGDDDDDEDYNEIVENRNNKNQNNENNRIVDEYDDEGIRRPDPVKNQRLVSGYHNMSTDPLARADDPSVEWIYKPPSQLSYPGSWTDAKVVAKDDSKWLLVNIQSHTEFTSHRLNGETWNDDTIEAIVRSSFLFWQRGLYFS